MGEGAALDLAADPSSETGERALAITSAVLREPVENRRDRRCRGCQYGLPRAQRHLRRRPMSPLPVLLSLGVRAPESMCGRRCTCR